jgi:hypothetical protein
MHRSAFKPCSSKCVGIGARGDAMGGTVIYDFARDGAVGWSHIQAGVALAVGFKLVDWFNDLFEGDSWYAHGFALLPILIGCTTTALANRNYHDLLSRPSHTTEGPITAHLKVVGLTRKGRELTNVHYCVGTACFAELPAFEFVQAFVGRESKLTYVLVDGPGGLPVLRILTLTIMEAE